MNTVTTEAFLQSMLARPKNFRVTTSYADGKTHVHDVNNIGQAENWAYGQRQKMGRDLIDRMTGEKVRVVAVTISSLEK